MEKIQDIGAACAEETNASSGELSRASPTVSRLFSSRRHRRAGLSTNTPEHPRRQVHALLHPEELQRGK
jgi:hypothetical protein